MQAAIGREGRPLQRVDGSEWNNPTKPAKSEDVDRRKPGYSTLRNTMP